MAARRWPHTRPARDVNGSDARIRCKDQMQGSDARIRCKDQMQGSDARIRCKDQMQGSDVRISCRSQMAAMRGAGPVAALAARLHPLEHFGHSAGSWVRTAGRVASSGQCVRRACGCRSCLDQRSHAALHVRCQGVLLPGTWQTSTAHCSTPAQQGGVVATRRTWTGKYADTCRKCRHMPHGHKRWTKQLTKRCRSPEALADSAGC
jgi:hypothetical protein